VLGGIVGAGVLYLIATDKPGFAVSAGFASNGYGAHTGVALFVGDWAVAQLWLFWLAPIVGGVLGAVVYRLTASEKT
jgi:glycerol uptake facilitator-like aquaporin